MASTDTILKLLAVVGTAAARLPKFKSIFDELVATFHPKDRASLEKAYAELVDANDAGHQRLQAKLRAAEED